MFYHHRALAAAPHATVKQSSQNCDTDTENNWYRVPWTLYITMRNLIIKGLVDL